MSLNKVKDKNNNYSLLKLDYDFTKMLRKKDSLDNYPFVRNIDYELVDRISSLLNFTTQYDTDSLSFNKESILAKERYNLTSKVINTSERSIITPREFINYLKYRSENKYQQITEEEVEVDLKHQFNLFSKERSYKEIIYALDLFMMTYSKDMLAVKISKTCIYMNL